MTLTKPQLAALRIVHNGNDRSRINRGVLGRLRALGLITSEAPFAYAFHTVRITDAGRKALDEAS